MKTEYHISRELGRTIKSPIRIGKLCDLGIETGPFLDHFKLFFENLGDDEYLVREKHIAYLCNAFEEDADIIKTFYRPYFEGNIGIEVLEKWINRLSPSQKNDFDKLSIITRQRAIATFKVTFELISGIKIERLASEEFNQEVADFRAWTRSFEEADAVILSDEKFVSFLRQIAIMVRTIHPEASGLKISAHFMRTLCQDKILGENSPEGIHEDGAQYIVSALVVNRENISGGETQIFELLENDEKAMLYNQVLNPGEFVFQADTGEEKTFGNDLWHYVTPIQPLDESKQGIRDIIGFDIDLVSN